MILVRVYRERKRNLESHGDIIFGTDLPPIQYRKTAFKHEIDCLEGRVFQNRHPPGIHRLPQPM